MKQERRIARSVDALKNLADICDEFKSDKGLHRRLRNIAKVIMWNLSGLDRKLVKEGLKGHPTTMGDEVLDSDDPQDGVVPTAAGHTPPLPADDMWNDSDIEAMLREQGPTDEVMRLAQERAKSREGLSALMASRRLIEIIPHADARSLAQLAMPILRSSGGLQDREPPKSTNEKPPGVKIKLSDGKVMELGDLINSKKIDLG